MEKPKTFFEHLAQERNITVEEMRAIIAARIEQGMTLTRRNGHRGSGYHALGKFPRQRSGSAMR